MQLYQPDFMNRARMPAPAWRRLLAVAGLGLLAAAALAPRPAAALTMDIFLISEQSAPAAGAGSSFSVVATTAYQLGGLNSNSKATTLTAVDPFSFGVDGALTYSSHFNPRPLQPIDPGETGAGTAAYVNAEVATWDNAGIAGGVIDPDEQVDFGRSGSITFNALVDGFIDLVLADLGGLNPFSMVFCPDAACTTVTPIFDGLNRGVTDLLLAMDDFAASDTGVESEMDQTWLFRFSEPVYDYVRVTENDDRNTFTGARLQVDFIGAGGPSVRSVPAPVGLPMLAGAVAVLALARRRRRA